MDKSDSEQMQSDSGSDDGFDPAEYARQKNENLRKAVLADIQYHQARTLLRDLKFAEVAKRKEQLKNKTCPEYLRRRQEILDDEKRQRLESRALFELEKEALENDIEARRSYILSEQNDNREAARQKLIEKLEAEIAERLKHDAEMNASMAHFKDSSLTSVNGPYVVTREDSEALYPERRRRAVVLQGTDTNLLDTNFFPYTSPCSRVSAALSSSDGASTSGSAGSYQENNK